MIFMYGQVFGSCTRECRAERHDGQGLECDLQGGRVNIVVIHTWPSSSTYQSKRNA